MAQLTATLPLTNGTNRVIDDPATPSGVGNVLEALSGGLDAFMDMQKERSESKRRAAAEEEKRREAAVAFESQSAYFRVTGEDRSPSSPTAATQVTDNFDAALPPAIEGVEGAPAGPAEQVFSMGQEGDVSPEAQQAASTSGKRLANVQAAVDQGRMPRVAMATAMNREYQALLNKYPDQAEHLLDIWKKMGMDTTVFRAGRDEADQHEFQREFQQNEIQKQADFKRGVIENAIQVLGPAIALNESTGKPYTEDELFAHGITVTSQAHQFQMVQQEADLRLRIAQGNREATEFAEREKNQRIQQLSINGLYNDSNPLMTLIQNISSSILALPEGEHAAKWEMYAPRINQYLDNYVEQGLQAAIAAGYTGSPSELRSNLEATVSRAKELWAGDFKVATAYQNALNAAEISLKLNAAQAMPVYTALRGMGINAETIQGYMEGLQGNTELSGALRQEMLGFNTEFGQEKASTRLMNIVKILRGEATLANMSAQEARRQLPTLYETSRALNARYVAGQPINPDEILNGIGNITIATRSLGPTSGVDALRTATAGFATPPARAALLKALNDPNADNDQVEATIMASRAASAQVLNINLRNLPKINQNPYFELKWDNRNGTFGIDARKKIAAVRSLDARIVKARANPDLHLQLTKARARIVATREPTEMVQMKDIANVNLDNIMALGKADPNTPKGSNLELRRYYGQNIVPPSMKNGAGEPINIDKEINSQFEALDRTLDDLSSVNQNVEIPKDAKDWSSSPRYGEIAPLVSSAAEKNGVPTALALNVIGEESSFNPDAAGPVITKGIHKGDRAMGLGQVMAATAAKYGVSDRAKLSPAQQADLAMRVLADNYKSTGNWKDAVSMYFTGTTYAKALARNANDGNEGIMKYVNDALRGLNL